MTVVVVAFSIPQVLSGAPARPLLKSALRTVVRRENPELSSVLGNARHRLMSDASQAEGSECALGPCRPPRRARGSWCNPRDAGRCTNLWHTYALQWKTTQDHTKFVLKKYCCVTFYQPPIIIQNVKKYTNTHTHSQP
ncbi:uncharacterized protein LOC130541119 [Pan paniscus]|uniref:uncharacterized protein LOC130541119 n=1 Tax=Pan paniscus TaxID=9597 RepID=UPI0030078371